MADLVEKVANAIHMHSTAGVPLMLARPVDAAWAFEAARAAIKAMRDPTNEMMGNEYGSEPRRLFTGMINAALAVSSHDRLRSEGEVK